MWIYFGFLLKGGVITETVMDIRAERLDHTVEEGVVVGAAEAQALMVEAGMIGRIKIVARKSGVRRTEIVVEDGAAAAAPGVAGIQEMTVVLAAMLVVQGGVMPRRVLMMAEVGDAEKSSRRRFGRACNFLLPSATCNADILMF